jgi:transposase
MSNSVCQNVAEAGSVGQSVIQSVGQSLSLSAVRLRRPERKQIQMMVRCVDDLVKPSHQVRAVAGVAAALDLSRFCEPIKARQGHAGRDATDPQLLVSLWLYGCIRGIGSARELARRCSADEGSAPFQWLCGGVTVNHHMLSDFRVEHADALDELFTQVVASLVDKGLVKVSRISQDGVRVRACAGASSYRREQRLEQLLDETRAHIAELRRQLDDPAQAAAMASKQSARQAAAKKRAAEEKADRLQQAIAQLPELKKKQQDAAKKAGSGKHGQKILDKEPRVSSTDPEARVMKMPNGGFNPAVNVQLATDTASRAIIGVAVSNEGSDSAGLSEPMRRQVEQRSKRSGKKVDQHLLDGGFIKNDDIEQAHAQQTELFMPPKPARNQSNRGRELEPKPGDSEAILAWKARMRSEAGKAIYKERAATSETVNADLRRHRGLIQLTVRGLAKGQCVALWCALAYNVMHFAHALLA